MTLVKSLYSGDPDVIVLHDRWCYLGKSKSCRGLPWMALSGQVGVPNSQQISCLDSSLGRVVACGAGGRTFAPRM
jgi:hypothetical protein